MKLVMFERREEVEFASTVFFTTINSAMQLGGCDGRWWGQAGAVREGGTGGEGRRDASDGNKEGRA
jgi:hypothetical protein